jgi:hypothetical protein
VTALNARKGSTDQSDPSRDRFPAAALNLAARSPFARPGRHAVPPGNGGNFLKTERGDVQVGKKSLCGLCNAKISFPKLLPVIIGCTGAVVVASENSDPQAALVLKLRTEAGQEVPAADLRERRQAGPEGHRRVQSQPRSPVC